MQGHDDAHIAERAGALQQQWKHALALQRLQASSDSEAAAAASYALERLRGSTPTDGGKVMESSDGGGAATSASLASIVVDVGQQERMDGALSEETQATVARNFAEHGVCCMFDIISPSLVARCRTSVSSLMHVMRF